MTHKDFIIIGKGIAGTITALELFLKGYKVALIHQPNLTPSTSIAGAVLNPHNIRKSLPASPSTLEQFRKTIAYYRNIESLINTNFIFPKTLLQLKTLKNKDSSITDWIKDQEYDETYFFDTRRFLNYSAIYLTEKTEVIEATVNDENLLYKNNHWQFQNICAPFVIHCEGAYAIQNVSTSDLKLTKNHGDILFVHIPNLSDQYIYQFEDSRLLPIGGQIFWMGTQHKWNCDNPVPDSHWRKKQETILKEFLNIPFSILEHKVGKRPTTAGQKVIHTLDKDKQTIFINGLGSKGLTNAVKIIPNFIEKEILPFFHEIKNNNFEQL